MSQELRSPEIDQAGSEAAAGPRRPRLPPIAYPVLGFALGIALVWAFSRILLAVTEADVAVFGLDLGGKTAAALIALLMSLNVLIGAALVAYGRRVRRRPVSLPLVLAAGLVLIGVGAVGNGVIGQEERPQGGEAAPPQTVPLEASGIAFDTAEIPVRSGGKVEVQFQNQDAGVPHNFSVYTDDSATQPIFQGPIVTGPGAATYSFDPPPPGEYFFRCDVHPVQMTGTFIVGPPGGPGGGGQPGQPGQPGAPGAAAALAAQGIAFTPTNVTATAKEGKVTIHFDNEDSGVPHNVAVFQGSDATGDVIFRGEIVTGPGKVDYTFDAPPPGAYFFHCDVHPQMQGQITIE